MKKTIKTTILLLICLVSSTGLFARQIELSYFQGSINQENIHEVDFKKAVDLNLGYIDDEIYVKLDIKKAKGFIVINYPFTDLEAFILSENRVEKIHVFKYRKWYLKSDMNQIFLKIKTNTAIILDVESISFYELIQSLSLSFFALGIFYGIIGIYILIYLFNGIMLKEASQILLAMFSGSYALLQMAMNGLLNSVTFIPSLTFVTFGIFSFFLIKNSEFKKINRIIIFISCILFVISFFVSYPIMIKIAFLYQFLITIVILLTLAFNFIELKNMKSKFILISWVPFFVGISLLTLKTLGVLESNLITNYFAQVGAIIAIFILLFLMSSEHANAIAEKEKSRFNLELLQNDINLKAKHISTMREVAHDLKSPLAMLKTLEGHTEGKVNEMMKMARERIQSILGSVDQATLSLEIFSVNDVVQQIVSEKAKVFDDCDIKMNFANEIQIQFSRVQFERILSNLINNAYEAIEKAPKKIIITVSDDASLLKVQIQDNGKGIPANIKTKIFDVDFTFGKDNGTGLGLFHAKKYVEAFGGSLNFESSTNGTNFIILLPKA